MKSSSGCGASNTYGFTSRENEAALMYYRTRYYDPSAGRFTSSDSAGLCGGYNRYAYVGNNPANRIDPSGRLPSRLFDGGGSDSYVSGGVGFDPVWYSPIYTTNWDCVRSKFGQNCACLLFVLGIAVPAASELFLGLTLLCLERTPPGLCNLCTAACAGAVSTKDKRLLAGCGLCLLAELAIDIKLCSTRVR
ncbi:MAG TPA: RHS repeat-associated core domain-containing protein [Thermoplasmata archaeon]